MFILRRFIIKTLRTAISAFVVLSSLSFGNAFALEQINNQVYLRGTSDNWTAQAMTLVDNNTWEITATFAGSGAERFKFDTVGDWSGALGDTQADGVAQVNGADISTPSAGSYKITFYSRTSSYRITRVDPVQSGVGSGEGVVAIDLNSLVLEGVDLATTGASDWEIYLDGNSPFGGPVADGRTGPAGEASLTLARAPYG